MNTRRTFLKAVSWLASGLWFWSGKSAKAEAKVPETESDDWMVLCLKSAFLIRTRLEGHKHAGGGLTHLAEQKDWFWRKLQLAIFDCLFYGRAFLKWNDTWLQVYPFDRVRVEWTPTPQGTWTFWRKSLLTDNDGWRRLYGVHMIVIDRPCPAGGYMPTPEEIFALFHQLGGYNKFFLFLRDCRLGVTTLSASERIEELKDKSWFDTELVSTVDVLQRAEIIHQRLRLIRERAQALKS